MNLIFDALCFLVCVQDSTLRKTCLMHIRTLVVFIQSGASNGVPSDPQHV